MFTKIQRNFHFDSDLWSNKNSFNLDEGKLGFNTKETKLPTYWNTPFSKVCLGTRNNNKMKYTVIDKQASSLYSLIADGNYRPTSLGRDTWKSLIGSQGSLQSSCNQEGFNVVGSGEIYRPKARIGILGNNENHCRTCDSRIGFGTGGKQDDSNTCGNETSHGYEHTHIKAMGFILVLNPSAGDAFYWIDGTPLADQFSAWASGEPNHVKEKCAHMYAVPYRMVKWNDKECSLSGAEKNTDECSASNGGCSHKCVNTVGGYRCECPEPGLSLALDNKTCHDTDECSASNGGCSHRCVNTAGSYRCECPGQELRLASDNKTCEEKHTTSGMFADCSYK
ncbi:signal peptide, CUB and EGF-like domain-containing protein 3 [Orbicella faveolata]|uniref:signal peptide, CUB and EGF-like domain-containing protein 3 n=1 Tax=Orbicella faveolata TaxID=48498 RepID=UPI0009E590D9|nr:signal peptide, CUB and EGF-like domain-containing protein 3 [Orbicella faveolata]